MNSTVTYTPADNKLRLYVGRVPRDEYEELRAAGFVSTPKQDCDFAAVWTPYREDLARQYLEEGEDIADEDYSPTERAADRAERFAAYRDKRADEATGAADRFEAGPAVYGHQNQARAERQARRADRTRAYSVSQWDKAEYWQERTRAVIAHALRKESASVRRGRILTLEAEQRKHEKARQEYAAAHAAWSKVPTMEGADQPGRLAAPSTTTTTGNQTVITLPRYEGSPAYRLAYSLANTLSCGGNYKHPRRELDPNAYNQGKRDLYSLLTDEADPITPAEAAALWLDGAPNPTDPDTSAARWTRHYELRLAYERQMLEAEGGTAAAADMEPGGWIGKFQIHKVNKSPATGRVVSCLLAKHGDDGDSWDYRKRGKHIDAAGQVWTLYHIDIQRLPADAYRAPTDEERAAFAQAKKAAPKAPPLLNPSKVEAERLQALMNTPTGDRYNDRAGKVQEMTQEKYSWWTKRSHHYGTIALDAQGRKARYSKQPAVCKVRVNFSMYTTDDLICLTDKPTKPLPIDWTAAEEVRKPQQAAATA